MKQNCDNAWCKAPFEVTDDDLTFLDRLSPVIAGQKHSLPPPHLCSHCRHQRRMAFRNERRLYRRACSKTGKPMLSIYDVDAPFPVYCHEAWWSDAWSALDFGRAYDPKKPFFEQFGELFNVVPRLGIVTGHNENCDYCNYTNYSKDSYLCFGCHSADHCLHNWRVHWSEHCVDCLQMDRSHYCYECIDCESCYNLAFSQDCETCAESAFLYDCKGCKHCIGCSGLRNAEYRIFNEQLHRDSYEAKRKELHWNTWSGMEALHEKFHAFLRNQPHRNLFLLHSEDVTGDHIAGSRHLHECYHVKNAEDCRYLESCEEIKDSMDNTFSGWPAELVYETMSAGVQCSRQSFCTASWSSNDLLYCDSCHHSHSLFGCIGLRSHNTYCILNKQYSKDKYLELVPKIIDRMKDLGEWGRFFPMHLSPHAYNETVAQEFYPLSQDEAAKHGFRWKTIAESMSDVTKTIAAETLPESIDDIPDDIQNWAITCEATGRPFKMIKQELEFYREHRLPIPRLHPDERHRRRMALRNPRKLWPRTCGKCGKEMQSTYAPDRPEIVFCEQCYLAAVY